MRKLLRILGAGALFGLVAVATPLVAAQLNLFTGPAGTNPINQPQNLGDMNTLVNGINANAAFADTGTPSAVLGALQVPSGSSSKFGTGNPTTTLLQFMNSAFLTSTTGSGTCGLGLTSTQECLGVIDAAGVLRWIILN